VIALEYLEKHLPAKKAAIIIDYITRHNCTLRITRPRKTKRGDFRQLGIKQLITINQDSNSFRFLFTLIHELSHLETFIQYKNQVKPHGIEWKYNFKKLFDFFEMGEEFSVDNYILQAVKSELKNPKACSGVNVNLEQAFAVYDCEQGVLLDQISTGDFFLFRNKQFKKLQTRRTRVLCLNITNNRTYTINRAVKIQRIDSDLFRIM
jgi:hypothetical protein